MCYTSLRHHGIVPGILLRFLHGPTTPPAGSRRDRRHVNKVGKLPGSRQQEMRACGRTCPNANGSIPCEPRRTTGRGFDRGPRRAIWLHGSPHRSRIIWDACDDTCGNAARGAHRGRHSLRHRRQPHTTRRMRLPYSARQGVPTDAVSVSMMVTHVCWSTN